MTAIQSFQCFAPLSMTEERVATDCEEEESWEAIAERNRGNNTKVGIATILGACEQAGAVWGHAELITVVFWGARV